MFLKTKFYHICINLFKDKNLNTLGKSLINFLITSLSNPIMKLIFNI